MAIQKPARSLDQLRHTAKAVLATAVIELFPGTLLVGGEVDEIGFFYDFIFSDRIVTLFGQRELEQIEDHFLRIVVENRPIKALDMMRENAALFFRHHGQPLRAKQAETSPDNILSLIQIGQCYDLCPTPDLKATGELKAIKIQRYEQKPERTIRIYGTAFFEKEKLKEFLKEFRSAHKKDFEKIGAQADYFVTLQKENRVWLPKGENLQWSLMTFWRQFHLKHHYALISCEPSHNRREIHAEILRVKNLHKVASIALDGSDLATIRTFQQEVFEALISSLQFFLEAFKIFAFENLIYCKAGQSSLLVKALEHLKIKWMEETRLKGKECVTFNTLDGYGRRVMLSTIELEETNQMIHHTFFCSIHRWMACCVEKGVKKLEFENQ